MASASASASGPDTWTVEECFEAARAIQRKLRRVYGEPGEKFVLAGFPTLYKCRMLNDHPLRAMFKAVRLPKTLTPIFFHVPPRFAEHDGWKAVCADPNFEQSSTVFVTPIAGSELHECVATLQYALGGPYGCVENWEAIAVDQLRFGATLPEHEQDARFAVLMIVRWAVEAGRADLLFNRGRPNEHSSVHEALLIAMKHVLDHAAERRTTRTAWASHLSPSLLRRAAQWEHALPRSGPAADLGQLVSAYEILGGELMGLFQAMSMSRSLAKNAYKPGSRLQAARASAFM